MRGLICCVLLVLMAGNVLAADCVVGIVITNLRPDGVRATSSVLDVTLYSDIASCNVALSAQARALPHTAAAHAYPWDGWTFDCHVPTFCDPSDKGAVEPFRLVVYAKKE